MTTWKLPPKAKIYEAFSVIADERCVLENNSATITSSDGKKQYSVEWIPDNTSDKIQKISSNDNASYWQGYMGYPIIAILLITRRIQFDEEIIHHFKDVPWNALNKAANNNYNSVVNRVLSKIEDKKEVERIQLEVDNIYRQISALKLESLGKSRRPPGK